MKYRIREKKELKPSGVEWLGDIPNKWQYTKLKYNALIKGRIGFKGFTKNDLVDKNEGAMVLGASEISNDGKIKLNKVQYIKWSKYYESPEIMLEQNMLLLVQRGSVGKVALIEKLDMEATINPSLVLIKKLKMNVNYIYYFLKSSFIQNIILVETSSTAVPMITQEQINNYILCQPTDNEQQKIANFLDEKSKKFDDLISKKEELISKLQDVKQSLISEVVSGKLKVIQKDNKLQTIKRQKEELQDSKVDWLGDIPKDWQVKKTKYLFEIRKRIAGTLDYDVLSITQKGIKIKDITTGGGQLSMDYSKYQIVNVGDFAMNHMDLITGFVDIAKTQGVTSPDYRVFTLIDKNSVSNYYLYLFQMGYKNQIFFAFGQGSSQLGRWRFPTEEFKKFCFPNPSKDEQGLISKYLDDKLVHFDNTIEKTKQSITKLKQAKESLISEAVTGKIEVL